MGRDKRRAALHKSDMPRFCANLSTLFTELPMLERPAAAREAGFEAVEILYPYDLNAADLGHALARAGLPLALINGPPPNYTGTGAVPGFAALPGGQDRFQHDFKRTLRYAKALGAERIHIVAGEAEGPEARETYLRNLDWAARTYPRAQILIEPLNPQDRPGYFLNDFALALDLLDALDAPNVSLQFDVYHAHRITGDVPGTWEAVRHQTGHVQVADAPGRHEPGSGEIDFPLFFATLEFDGYTGWVSAEYTPAGRTPDGLGWLEAARRKSAAP